MNRLNPRTDYDPRRIAGSLAPALRRAVPGNERLNDQDQGFRPTRDDPQGSRFQRQGPYPDYVHAHADASYQGYGAYATLDGSRVDTAEFADLDWAGPMLEPDRPAVAGPERDHAGRGPRGWRRSDASLYEAVCEQLTHDPDIDASEVEVVVHEGEVFLHGAVDRRSLKRLAEDLAYRVRGVLDVHNRLRVVARADERRPEDRPTARDDARLRDPGTPAEQDERARDRRNLRDHGWTGPRGTSRSERIGEV